MPFGIHQNVQVERMSNFPHAVYKDEGCVKDKSVLCRCFYHRVLAQSSS